MRTNDKRTITHEGFLLSDAVIGRVGDLQYTRGELGLQGGNPEDTITLSRTKEVLRDALPTMKGAPLTIEHPDDFVNPDNAGSLVVGSVVDEPRIGTDGKVRASVKVYRRDAIDLVTNGIDQLSPGFEFQLKPTGRDTGDITGMQLNHIAIVRRGRAGESVRILDHLPQPVRHYGAIPMSGENTQLLDEIRAAVKDAVSAPAPKEGLSDEVVQQRIADSVGSRLDPLIKDVTELKAKQAKDEAEAKAKDAEAAVQKRIDDAVKAERSKVNIIEQAKPFIAADKHPGLMEMSSDEVMRLAIGDSVPGADKMNTDGLMGALLALGALQTKDTKPKGVVSVGDSKGVRAKDTMDEIYAELTGGGK